MPRIRSLPAAAEDVRARGWSHVDVRCHLHAPDAVAWTEGDALVCSYRDVVHAVDDAPFGPSSALLAELLPALPDVCELRCGPAAGGILAETHDIRMLAPYRRLVRTSRPALRIPKGTVALSADDTASVRDIPDRDAPPPPEPLPPGWVGWTRQGRLVAAVGPLAADDGAVLLSEPRIARAVARSDELPAFLAHALSRHEGDVALDLRVDRRDRRSALEAAGLAEVGLHERWRAVRRPA